MTSSISFNAHGTLPRSQSDRYLYFFGLSSSFAAESDLWTYGLMASQLKETKKTAVYICTMINGFFRFL